MMIAIYKRQSLFKKDSLSTTQQENYCIPACHGEPYESFEDLGYSGKNLKRPAFEQMMKKVRTGEINKILIYKLDRISRNISDFANLLIELEQYGCELQSVSENFDTTSPMGRAMIFICMVFAQMERENVSQRVHDNYYYRTELGFWGGGPAPYGYRLSKMKYKGKQHTVLAIDKKTAAVVRQIYEWYLEPNGSASTILDKLNNEFKIPGKKGGLWSSRVIMDILSKPLYAPNDMNMYNYLLGQGANISNPPEEFDGLASIDMYGKKKANSSKHKRTRTADEMYCNVSNHEAIIDSDTWLRVQYKRQKMLKCPPRAGTGKHSWFTGLMKCGCCGASVSYTNSRGTQGYYLCSTKKNRGYTTCNQRPVSKKLIDPVIIEKTIEHFSEESVIMQLRSAELTDQVRTSSDFKERNDLMIQMTQIDKEIENLMSSLASGNAVLIKYINEKIVELDNKKTSIATKISALDSGTTSDREELSLLQQINEVLDEIPYRLHNGTFDDIRNLCHILIKKIVFQEDGDIIIEFTV